MGEKVKKPIYKRWWVWTLVFILVIAIAGVGNDEAALESPADETDVNEDEPVDEENDVGVEENDENEEVDQFVGIGETLDVGDAEFTVHDVDSTNSVGGDFLNETTEGQFIVVNITFMNNGDEAVTTDASFFNLVSMERTYEADTTASLYANENGSPFFLERVNPGMSRTGNVVFEVPAEEENFILEVQTGFFGTEKGQIDLGM